ncbi:MAG: hypothetical protein WCA79_18180 [Anaerolineales bacterium]
MSIDAVAQAVDIFPAGVIDRVALVPQVGQLYLKGLDTVPERLALFEHRLHHFQREVAELQGWVNGLPACDGGLYLVQNISGVGLGHLFLLSVYLPETLGFYNGRPSMNDGKLSNKHRWHGMKMESLPTSMDAGDERWKAFQQAWKAWDER